MEGQGNVVLLAHRALEHSGMLVLQPFPNIPIWLQYVVVPETQHLLTLPMNG